MKKFLHYVIDSIVAGLLRIRSGYRPPKAAHPRNTACLTDILSNPVNYAVIDSEALDVLYEEASIAASELVGPNSYEWRSTQEAQFYLLQQRFWDKFVTQYFSLSREGKI